MLGRVPPPGMNIPQAIWNNMRTIGDSYVPLMTFKQFITEGTPNQRLGDLYSAWQDTIKTNPNVSIPSQKQLRTTIPDRVISAAVGLHNHPKTPKPVKRILGSLLDLTFDHYLEKYRGILSTVKVPSQVPGEYQDIRIGIPHSPVLASSVLGGDPRTRGVYRGENVRTAVVNPFNDIDFKDRTQSQYDFISSLGHEVAHGVQDARVTSDPIKNAGLKMAGEKLITSITSPEKTSVPYEKYVTSSYEVRPRIEGAIATAARYKQDTGKFIPFYPSPDATDKFASFSHPIMTDMESTPEKPKKIRASRKKAILQAAKKAYGRIATREQEDTGIKINK